MGSHEPLTEAYRRDVGEERFDVIVIGSGIGGLAAAAVLAKRLERRVLVLERHHTAGGFTHSFRRPGYEWDMGVQLPAGGRGVVKGGRATGLRMADGRAAAGESLSGGAPELRPQTRLKGFYLTGQDVATAGVGGALAGGYLTASAVAGRPLLPR